MIYMSMIATLPASVHSTRMDAICPGYFNATITPLALAYSLEIN